MMEDKVIALSFSAPSAAPRRVRRLKPVPAGGGVPRRARSLLLRHPRRGGSFHRPRLRLRDGCARLQPRQRSLCRHLGRRAGGIFRGSRVSDGYGGTAFTASAEPRPLHLPDGGATGAGLLEAALGMFRGGLPPRRFRSTCTPSWQPRRPRRRGAARRSRTPTRWARSSGACRRSWRRSGSPARHAGGGAGGSGVEWQCAVGGGVRRVLWAVKLL